MKFGQDFADGFQNIFENDLADFAFVGAGFVFHFGDAMFFEAGVPGLDGAPGELARVAVLVSKGHLADGFDPGMNGVAWRHVDGAQDAHFQIDGGISHE